MAKYKDTKTEQWFLAHSALMAIGQDGLTIDDDPKYAQRLRAIQAAAKAIKEQIHEELS